MKLFRHLKGEDVGSLPHPDLMRLEDALETGLVSVRNKKASKLTFFFSIRNRNNIKALINFLNKS